MNFNYHKLKLWKMGASFSGLNLLPRLLMLFWPVGVHLDRLRANGIKSFFLLGTCITIEE